MPTNFDPEIAALVRRYGLTMRPEDAARELGMSADDLRAKLDAGEIPHVRHNQKRVVIPTRALPEYAMRTALEFVGEIARGNRALAKLAPRERSAPGRPSRVPPDLSRYASP